VIVIVNVCVFRALDACGVCGGDSSTCEGCDHVINSGMLFDVCGICGGNGTSCVGCDGVPYSQATEDECGVYLHQISDMRSLYFQPLHDSDSFFLSIGRC
jgi:hypothetical protein